MSRLPMRSYLYIVLKIPLQIAVLCILPLVVDGIAQAIASYESNNHLRLLTGPYLELVSYH